MGKPLKAKQLKGSSLRAAVLSRQGVKINKRARLGHTGHFGKVTEIPIDKKPRADGGAGAGNGPKAARKSGGRSRFNKFKSQGEGGEGQGEGDGGHAGHEADGFAMGEEAAGGKTASRTERLPGESFCKFMKRLNSETREKLIAESAKARKVSTKRKEHLANRKDKKKDKQDRKAIARAKDNDSDDALPGVDPVTRRMHLEEKTYVKFGEQADRPPLIKMHKPLKGLQKAVAHDAKGYVVGGIPCIPEVSGHEASKREFEALRKNAIAQYREMTSKRRQEKGFGTVGLLPGESR